MPALYDELSFNQRSSHVKFTSAKTFFDTPECKAQEEARHQEHDNLAPLDPTDVLRFTTDSRRVIINNPEGLKWPKEIRPSTCIHGIDACLREYNNGNNERSLAHRKMFLHPWPIFNSYPGLNYMDPIPYVETDENLVTKFMTSKDCNNLFLKGFSDVLLDHGKSLENVDQLPNYKEIITHVFVPEDIHGILGQEWTPLQKRIFLEAVVCQHPMAKALAGDGESHPMARGGGSHFSLNR
jgi:hypothetical protein